MSQLIGDLHPDLVHAMRLPFEGLFAAAAVKKTPLVLSVWGNDFTLFADKNRALGRLTNTAMRRVNGLHCDCNRDLEIGFARGFSRTKPWRVLPGGGGIQTARHRRLEPDRELLRHFDIPEQAPIVINPRGVRTYVHSNTFFRAIPLVLKEVPDAFFLAIGLKGDAAAERCVRQLHIANSARLLPELTHDQLMSLFSVSQVSVSPTSHDGTPNTLLEAMACGCFPIAGDIDSVREWITDRENGFLCDPRDAGALASCVIQALQGDNLRSRAAVLNCELIRKRADYTSVMSAAETLYEEVRQADAKSLSQAKVCAGVVPRCSSRRAI